MSDYEAEAKVLRQQIASTESELVSRDERIRDLLTIEGSLREQLKAVEAISLTLTVKDAPAAHCPVPSDDELMSELSELRHQVQVCAIRIQHTFPTPLFDRMVWSQI